MSEEPKAEKSLRAKSLRQKFKDMKVLMSEKPKAEKSLRAKSPRQKFEDKKNLHERRSQGRKVDEQRTKVEISSKNSSPPAS